MPKIVMLSLTKNIGKYNLRCAILRKGGATKWDKFSEKFQGGDFHSKKFILQIFGTSNRAFEQEIIQKSNFRVQGMLFLQLH